MSAILLKSEHTGEKLAACNHEQLLILLWQGGRIVHTFDNPRLISASAEEMQAAPDQLKYCSELWEIAIELMDMQNKINKIEAIPERDRTTNQRLILVNAQEAMEEQRKKAERDNRGPTRSHDPNPKFGPPEH